MREQSMPKVKMFDPDICKNLYLTSGAAETLPDSYMSWATHWTTWISLKIMLRPTVATQLLHFKCRWRNSSPKTALHVTSVAVSRLFSHYLPTAESDWSFTAEQRWGFRLWRVLIHSANICTKYLSMKEGINVINQWWLMAAGDSNHAKWPVWSHFGSVSVCLFKFSSFFLLESAGLFSFVLLRMIQGIFFFRLI